MNQASRGHNGQGALELHRSTLDDMENPVIGLIHRIDRHRARAAFPLLLVLVAAAGCGSAASSEPASDETAASIRKEDGAPGSTTGVTASVAPTVGEPAPTVGEPAAAEPVEPPTPDELDVDDGRTRIVVESTADQYFVLYVRPSLEEQREIPVAVIPGEAGSTVLTDGRSQIPEDHYRFEAWPVNAPGDVDGDGLDDLAELADPNANPLNAAKQISMDQGATIVLDRAAFETLSYQGDDVARDAYLAGLEFVKFSLYDTDGPNPALYLMNTQTYRAHPRFAEAVGLPSGRGPRPGTMRGDIVYEPDGVAPDGSLGTYRFAFQPNDAFPFEDIALAFEMIRSAMPFLDGNLLYEPYSSAALPLYEQEKDRYDAYRIPILLR